MIRPEEFARAIWEAPLNRHPFDHIRLGRVFRECAYRSLLRWLPDTSHYGELRHKDAKLPGGGYARRQLPLTDEGLRSLDGEARRFWLGVAGALRDPGIGEAVRSKFADATSARGIKADARTSLRVSLVRDLPGYRIRPHQDIPQKAVTAQLYLPRDGRCPELGTGLYRRDGGGRLERTVSVPFLPNTGYAFAVTEDSWHGVGAIPPDAPVRDSLMLVWYVEGALPRLRAAGRLALRSLRRPVRGA